MNLDFSIRVTRPGFSLCLSGEFRAACTGVFGPSGAGKSTLFDAIAGQIRPQAGRIVLGGRILFDSKLGIFVPPHKRRVGVVFQDGRLFPHLSVKKNLLYGCGWLRQSYDTAGFNDLVETLDIGSLLQKKPGQLSGGEKQRVAIGRALLAKPEILLLDEPFSALDRMRKEEVLGLLLRVQEAVSTPLAIISHDLCDILQLTGKLYLIENGRCLGHGEYNDLMLDADAEVVGQGANILPFVISEDSDGMPVLCSAQGGQRVRATGLNRFKPGDGVYASISPGEIAVSLAPVEYISIQNQLRARVRSIHWQGETCLLLTDAEGLPLIADITARAAREFSLRAGQNIWLLFKARSVDVRAGFRAKQLAGDAEKPSVPRSEGTGVPVARWLSPTLNRSANRAECRGIASGEGCGAS